MPLEGLWWMDDMRRFSLDEKDDWRWTLLIGQPDGIGTDHFEMAIGQLTQRKAPPALARIRLEGFAEGLAVQIMHIGTYEAEVPTIARMHRFIAENGYEPAGKHHEIYLGDPRQTAPDKLKTILRQPVRTRG